MKPLEGIRVLDLSRVLAGPHCGRMLADLGADVIKLEPPDGDVSRTAQPRLGGISVYFWQQNVGKRNVSIDLRRPKGAELALKLAAASDVVLENYRPGVLDRLGLGFERVRAANPRVVYCSITGYGPKGPEAGRRAYAPVMHAEVGFLEFTARQRRADPQSEVFSHADLYSGLEAFGGILTALYQRERTGEGEHVQVSMGETLLFVNEWAGTELAGGDRGLPHVFGGFHAQVPRLGDGTWVCIPGNPVATFPAWCRAMDEPELLEDERFATPEARQKNDQELHEIIGRWVGGFSSFEALEEALGRERIAVGALRSVAEASSSTWATMMESVVSLPDRSGGDIAVPRVPIRFAGHESGPSGYGAYRGEHNREVLRDVLGLGDEEIDALETEGVVSSRRPEELL